MRNYRVFISSNRKSFLVDPESKIYYFLNSVVGNNTYFAKEAMEFRTVEEGVFYYFDIRYILCSDDLILHIYK